MKEYRKEAIRWLTHAEDEFNDAVELMERNKFYLALFHFQQAAEKALKAYLYNVAQSDEIFFTHSIYELIQMAKEKDADFDKIKHSSKLDNYYIPTRYPNALPGGVPSRYYDDKKECEYAMKLAKDVIELVKSKVYE